MKLALIVSRRGTMLPGGSSRIYQLRSGALGTGRVLGEHEARGDCHAHTQVVDSLRALAKRLGYEA